jgi:hypothetical protein
MIRTEGIRCENIIEYIDIVTLRERLNPGESPRGSPDGDDLSPSLGAHMGVLGSAVATNT